MFTFCLTVKQQACLVEWINSVLPDLHFPANASDNELRDILIDGSVLCRIVNKIKPGSISEVTAIDLDLNILFEEWNES